jgi:hypothetical protein
MKVRFIKGGRVRLHGRPYIVDGYIDGYWHFSPHAPSDKHATEPKFRIDRREKYSFSSTMPRLRTLETET